MGPHFVPDLRNERVARRAGDGQADLPYERLTLLQEDPFQQEERWRAGDGQADLPYERLTLLQEIPSSKKSVGEQETAKPIYPTRKV